jgi:hypothetical protein
MSLKFVFKLTGGLFVLGLISLIFFDLEDKKIKADNLVCNIDNIKHSFLVSLEEEKTIFFENFQKDSMDVILDDFLKREKQRYLNFNKLEELNEYYFKQQNTMFKEIIKFSLSSLQEEKNLEISLSKNSYPILSVYLDELSKQNKKEAEINFSAVVPSFVLGLEATLKYNVYACSIQEFVKTKFVNNEIQKIKNISGLTNKLRSAEQKVAIGLIDRKRILKRAVNAYQELIIAYPQHLAYLDLIENIKILKKQYQTLDDISFNCLIPNHFNTSCD